MAILLSWSINASYNPNQHFSSFVVEIDKLTQKLIWKCIGPNVARITSKTTKLKDYTT